MVKYAVKILDTFIAGVWLVFVKLFGKAEYACPTCGEKYDSAWTCLGHMHASKHLNV